MNNRKEKLLNEYDKTIDITQPIPPFQDYIYGLVDFLIDKIEKLENPLIEVQIPVKEGGEKDHDDTQENQSETPQG